MVTIIITIIGAIGGIFGSTGYWTYRGTKKKFNKEYADLLNKSATLIIAECHHNLVNECTEYIKKNEITQAQLDDLMQYYNHYDMLYTDLYNGYKNGTLELMIDKVKKIPIIN